MADLGIAWVGPAADGVVGLRIRPGTDDLAAGPAMTADDAVDAGTGVSGRALDAKREAVRTAVARVGPSAYPLEARRQVGGLEIAGLVEVTLEAAAAGRMSAPRRTGGAWRRVPGSCM